MMVKNDPLIMFDVIPFIIIRLKITQLNLAIYLI